MNPGKILERQFSLSAKNQNIFTLRLRDTEFAYDRYKQKVGETSFTQKQPCDFIFFQSGILFPLELKSTCGKSISFEREPSSGGLIKSHQLNSLKEFSEYDGVCPGFILEFRTEDELKNVVDTDIYFIHIKDFLNFMCETDKSSINKLDIVDHNGIIIECKKLRKYYTYNVKKLFKDIAEKQWMNEEDF